MLRLKCFFKQKNNNHNNNNNIGLLLKLGHYVHYWMHVLSITPVAPETTDSISISSILFQFKTRNTEDTEKISMAPAQELHTN